MSLLKLPQDQDKLKQLVSAAEYAALLVPNPQRTLIDSAVEAAREFGFASVIATPYLAPTVCKRLAESKVNVLCNVGMMTGLESLQVHRVGMIANLISQGVNRFDVGMERGRIDDENYAAIKDELSTIASILHEAGGSVGATLEVGALNDDQKKRLADVAITSGVDYIRLCSGLDLLSGVNNGRANLHEICFMKAFVGNRIKIKAGGGWDYAYAEDCWEQLQCGAAYIDVGDRFIEQLRALGFRR